MIFGNTCKLYFTLLYLINEPKLLQAYADDIDLSPLSRSLKMKAEARIKKKLHTTTHLCIYPGTIDAKELGEM